MTAMHHERRHSKTSPSCSDTVWGKVGLAQGDTRGEYGRGAPAVAAKRAGGYPILSPREKAAMSEPILIAPPQEAPPAITLTVTLKPGGVIEVNGPLADEILCYGLLEKARQVVAEHRRRQATGEAVQQAPAALLQHLKGMAPGR